MEFPSGVSEVAGEFHGSDSRGFFEGVLRDRTEKKFKSFESLSECSRK